MQQNSKFEISKVYNIGLQRCRNYKIRVCVKDSTSLLQKKCYKPKTDFLSPKLSFLMSMLNPINLTFCSRIYANCYIIAHIFIFIKHFS